MEKLTATGLVPVIKEEARKKPLLGICLGMQLLFEKSYEYGEHQGLGFVQGEVCPLEPDLKDPALKVPQIGWNALHILRDDPLFQYIQEGEYVYYVHSYYGRHCTASTLAVSDYSIPVTGVVRFEMDTGYRLQDGDSASYTAESIIGEGTIAAVEDPAEKEAGLDAVMNQITGKDQWTYGPAKAGCSGWRWSASPARSTCDTS